MAKLRLVMNTAKDLERALDALDGQSWHAQVRSALGRIIPAAEISWMRVREVWLHAVDLDVGAYMADLPAEVINALLGHLRCHDFDISPECDGG
jgi:maleylpyruvate isomerase